MFIYMFCEMTKDTFFHNDNLTQGTWVEMPAFFKDMRVDSFFRWLGLLKETVGTHISIKPSKNQPLEVLCLAFYVFRYSYLQRYAGQKSNWVV